MSETIRKYRNSKEWFKEGEDMCLTALVGGEKYGSSIQFTVGDSFIVMTETQLLDLVSIVAKRINHTKGFTATGRTDLKIVEPDGKVIVEEEE